MYIFNLEKITWPDLTLITSIEQTRIRQFKRNGEYPGNLLCKL